MGQIGDENTKKIYKEKKSKAKKAVAMAKGHAYDDLYTRLETKECEKSCTDWLGRETEQGKMYCA